MTIGTQASSTTLAGNGVTTSFPYAFIIPDASDAVVTYTSPTGVQTVLTALQYNISGINSPTGGAVTYPLFGSPIAAGSYLTIARVLPLIQGTSISSQGPTFAAIEHALDYLMMCIQQVNNVAGHSISAPLTDPAGLNYVLPSATARAGSSLAA